MAEHQCGYEREMGGVQTNIGVLLRGQKTIIEKLDKQNGRVRRLEIIVLGGILPLIGIVKWLL